ncbi:universal stress protein [Kineosporia succinea]|uniref:Nucleotide-binding universal stress UspA family protein n=1 Tax=Kineosporia succinea TaxID=84632 RepID=A0ABT9PCZ0_9ACTN|nr:universal stress protein [Kineosporia succinea]MDP9830574.1 nucleotide-binding universal stress UspA family protein [Kineosporia succinea]
MTFRQRTTVVGYDGSRSARAALDWATADVVQRGSELLVLHVEGSPETPATVLAEALARVRRRAPELPVTLESGRSLVAASCTAEMVVLGVPEQPHALIAALVAGAHCPVILVSGRTPVPEAGGAVRVGFDGSPGAERALFFAAERADRLGVPLVVTVAFSGTAAASPAADAAAVLAESARVRVRRTFPGVRVSHEVLEGTAVPVLSEASRDCGLVVVGNQGRGLTTGPRSSVGHDLVTRSHSPLAVVH